MYPPFFVFFLFANVSPRHAPLSTMNDLGVELELSDIDSALQQLEASTESTITVYVDFKRNFYEMAHPLELPRAYTRVPTTSKSDLLRWWVGCLELTQKIKACGKCRNCDHRHRWHKACETPIELWYLAQRDSSESADGANSSDCAADCSLLGPLAKIDGSLRSLYLAHVPKRTLATPSVVATQHPQMTWAKLAVNFLSILTCAMKKQSAGQRQFALQRTALQALLRQLEAIESIAPFFVKSVQELAVLADVGCRQFEYAKYNKCYLAIKPMFFRCWILQLLASGGDAEDIAIGWGLHSGSLEMYTTVLSDPCGFPLSMQVAKTSSEGEAMHAAVYLQRSEMEAHATNEGTTGQVLLCVYNDTFAAPHGAEVRVEPQAVLPLGLLSLL